MEQLALEVYKTLHSESAPSLLSASLLNQPQPAAPSSAEPQCPSSPREQLFALMAETLQPHSVSPRSLSSQALLQPVNTRLPFIPSSQQHVWAFICITALCPRATHTTSFSTADAQHTEQLLLSVGFCCETPPVGSPGSFRLHLLGLLEYLYQIISSHFTPSCVTVLLFSTVYYYSITFNNRSATEPLLSTAAT